MTRPVLIAHGSNDTRVPRAESDRIVRSLKRLGKDLVYALFFDEGHWFSRPANEVAYYALAEHFLAQHLGGRAEPFEDDLKDADIAVLAGTDRIPGLRAALPEVKLR